MLITFVFSIGLEPRDMALVWQRRFLSGQKPKGKCKTYFDSADPIPNEYEISRLMEKVLQTDLVDVLSVNENEAVTFASLLSSEVSKQRKKIEFNELALFVCADSCQDFAGEN